MASNLKYTHNSNPLEIAGFRQLNGRKIMSNTVSITQAIRIMAHRLAINPKCSFLLQGAPGTAKTAMANQLAKVLGRKLVTRKLASQSPEMLGGYPYRDDNTLRFSRPDWFPTEPGYMVFIDEVGQCPVAVQNIVMSLPENGRMGQFQLPDDTVVIMAANRATDRAGSIQLTTAFMSRFDCVLTIDPEKAEWLDWAIDNQLHPMLIAAVKSLFNKVVDFTAKEKGGFLTLRTLEQVSKALFDYNADANNPDLKVCVHSCIGEQYGSQILGFIQSVGSLPDYTDILADPDTAPVEMAMADPISKIIANDIKYAHVSKVLRYIKRYPVEQQKLFNTAMPTTIADHPDVVAWDILLTQ